MSLRSVLSLAAFLFAVACLPHAVHAQEDGFRLNGGLGLGFAGKAKLDENGMHARDDLIPTVGMYLGAEYACWRFLSLGGEVGLAFWNTDTRANPPSGVKSYGRESQLDVLARPKLRFPIGSLEIYGVVPIGLTQDFPNSDAFKPAKAHGKPGYAAGISAGVGYFVIDSLALNLEAGFLHRSFGIEAKYMGSKDEGDVKFDQFQLRAGVVIAL